MLEVELLLRLMLQKHREELGREDREKEEEEEVKEETPQLEYSEQEVVV